MASKTMAKFAHVLQDAKHITERVNDAPEISIENFIGYISVPVGLAGPLLIKSPDGTSTRTYAPIATTESAIIASCSRGCKALNESGGGQFHVLSEAMSRSPVFQFNCTEHAIDFARRVPDLWDYIAKTAKSTSRHARLVKLTPNIVGSNVHVRFDYTCGDAAGQNMVTIATQRVCDWLLASSQEMELHITGVFIEGNMAPDKKPSWGTVSSPRGVEVVTWASLSDEVCRAVLKCTAENLYHAFRTTQEGGIRNGQFGSNINVANVVTGIFIATGQDAAAVAEGPFGHLTPEYDHKSRQVKLTLYFPSLPVGTVGGGTAYETQREALGILGCSGSGMKPRLAGLIAAFSLALEISTAAAAATNTFTQSHERLARAKQGNNPASKI
ncbi:hypothetical protein N7489_004127 [Penicillium chrysogenum]|uniref:uncharacterized protein n=1 Tax=Penicillium chrysogenum TaxID=5076 RepID=UPI00238F9D7C|nr:uncharacterized protein N7489_004127 [Penicillium chrysogenum]KAJ5244031.1 hypothetical protein N7489_004127 [Penicillium chrysogenum]KAJ5285850.1 hypothetical protein N7524_001156 [Penicillium chrysogenum]